MVRAWGEHEEIQGEDLMDTVVLFGILSTAGISGLIFYARLYPQFFRKASPIKKNSWRRERALLIDRRFGIGEVVEREDLDRGKFALLVDTGYNRVKPVYEDGEIVPFNDGQVIADEGSPVFIRKQDKAEFIGGVDVGAELIRIKQQLDNERRKSNEWESDYTRLRANVNEEVERRVKHAEELIKARTAAARPGAEAK